MFEIKMILKDGSERIFKKTFKSEMELREYMYILYVISKVQNIEVKEVSR